MSELNTWGAVGYGTIGQELFRQIMAPGVAERNGLKRSPEFVLTGHSQYNYLPDKDAIGKIHGTPLSMEAYDTIFDGSGASPIPSPDVVFVTIPSDDAGDTALRYLLPPLDAGKIVVTAEKAALANHYDTLRKRSGNFARLRHNASVGGGTGIIDSLRERCIDPGNVNELHLSLNGTLSYIWGQVGPRQGLGTSLGEAVQQAQRLGYAEPGNNDAFAIIRAEAEQDVPKKVANLFNRLELTKELLHWKGLHFTLEDTSIHRAITEAAKRRLLVSIYPAGQDFHENEDVINRRVTRHAGWDIVMGFHDVEANPLYGPLANVVGASNGYTIGLGPNNVDGTYGNFGPGAGPNPTANRMIDDMLQARRDNVLRFPDENLLLS